MTTGARGRRGGVLFAGLLLLAAGCGHRGRLPGVNLILITIDTFRADHLGAYGRPSACTPHLDRLAREGSQFGAMYASVPLTLPSHTTILTGEYPARHGVHDNGAYRLGDERTTLAEYLSGAGYHTAAFVSSFQLDRKYGLAQGFDEYDDRMPKEFTIYDPRIASGPKAENIRYQSGQRRAGQITDLVRGWLGAERKGPFFLWLHYFDPHETYDPPPPYDRMNPGIPFPDSLYDGEIAYLDHEVGEFVRALREKGLYDRCLIVVAGDHGEGLGEHGERYHDTFLYDSTLRIPCFIGGGAADPAWPKVVSAPVRSVDILPTLLDAAGLKPSVEVQGESLLPLLGGGGRSKGWWSYAETYSPIHNLCAKLFSVRDDEWKYIEAPEPELYHVTEDPGETRNLIDAEPSKAKEFRGLLARAVPEEETGRIEIDEETREKLEAIGYVHREGEIEESVEGKDPKEILECTDGLHLSMLHFTYGRFDSSLAVLERIKDDCPGQNQIYDNIGNLRIRLGQYDETIAEFTDVVRRYPQYAKGYFWIGMAYYQTDRYEPALEWFRKGLAVEPKMQIAQYHVGLALGKMRRVDEALAAWEDAIRVNPDSQTGRLARRAYDEVWSLVVKSRGESDAPPAAPARPR